VSFSLLINSRLREFLPFPVPWKPYWDYKSPNIRGQASKLKCQTPLAIPQVFRKQFATIISVTTSSFMGFQ